MSLQVHLSSIFLQFFVLPWQRHRISVFKSGVHLMVETSLYMCAYLYLYRCMYVYMYLYVYRYIDMYVYLCVYTYRQHTRSGEFLSSADVASRGSLYEIPLRRFDKGTTMPCAARPSNKPENPCREHFIRRWTHLEAEENLKSRFNYPTMYLVLKNL